MKRYYIVEINDLWYFGVSNTSVLKRQYQLRRNVYLLYYPLKSPKVEPYSPYPSCIYQYIANIRQCRLRHRGVYKYVVFVCCWLHRQGFYKLGVDRQCARSARCGGNYKYIHLQLSGAKWLEFREKWNKQAKLPVLLASYLSAEYLLTLVVHLHILWHDMVEWESSGVDKAFLNQYFAIGIVFNKLAKSLVQQFHR